MVSAASYLHDLRSLANSELAAQAKSLLRDERRSSARVIAHLAEISRRDAHLELGYSNLFDYCVNGLGLSEGSANSRIHVARASHRVPLLLEAIASRKVSLTVASRLAAHLTAENCVRVLDECEGMTKRRVDEYVVRFRQKPQVSSGMRRQPQRWAGRPEGGGAGTEAAASAEAVAQGGGTAGELGFDLDAHAEETTNSEHSAVGGTPVVAPPPTSTPADARPTTSPSTRGTVEPCAPEVYNVRFAADRVFKEKLERLAEVLGVHRVEAELAAVLEHALDLALDKKDPERRRQRREERKARKEARENTAETKAERPCPDKVASECGEDVVLTRHVPVEIRDEILYRAGHRCEYVSLDGRRCAARVGLTVDHIQAFACDGTHDRENLRALCGPHNQLYAKQCFGSEFIEKKVEERRRRDSLTRSKQPPEEAAGQSERPCLDKVGLHAAGDA